MGAPSLPSPFAEHFGENIDNLVPLKCPNKKRLQFGGERSRCTSPSTLRLQPPKEGQNIHNSFFSRTEFFRILPRAPFFAKMTTPGVRTSSKFVFFRIPNKKSSQFGCARPRQGEAVSASPFRHRQSEEGEHIHNSFVSQTEIFTIRLRAPFLALSLCRARSDRYVVRSFVFRKQKSSQFGGAGRAPSRPS